jgi:hypothetical protein
MITREQLDEAVRRGLIAAEQRDSLIRFADTGSVASEEAKDTPTAGFDEQMRLIGGGNDVFVTIGVVMLSAGLFAALMTFLGDRTIIMFGIMAVFLWAVAEFVTRQRRMRLASTVIGLGFLFAVQAILTDWVATGYGIAMPENPLQLAAMRPQMGIAGTMLLGGIAGAAAVYFWRFRVPIMAGAIALSLTALAFFYVTLFLYDGVTEGRLYLPALDDLPELLRNALYMPLISGLVIFAVGVMFDLRDRERVTVWSDCAFWLHVISAPLLVHPLFIMSTGQDVVFGEIEPGANAMVIMTDFSPREIVSELDRFIIGQAEAKRAVAIALRNRWRRQQLPPEMRDEVLPKNILMIGPTGCGKTEIARRLAKLARAPFIKVEATKFTEVGYVGRDVEQIVRDLVEAAIQMETEQQRKDVHAKAELAAEERVIDALVGQNAGDSTRATFRKKLREGSLDDKEIEIEVADTGGLACRPWTSPACPAARWACSI